MEYRYGEDYIYRFGHWLDTLSQEERAEYRALLDVYKRQEEIFAFPEESGLPFIFDVEEELTADPAAMDAVCLLYTSNAFYIVSWKILPSVHQTRRISLMLLHQ